MNINMIGVPLKYGCGRAGVEKGPDKLREMNISGKLQSKKNNVYDMGNIYVPSVSVDDMYKDHKSMKFLNTIVDVNENLAHSVYSSLKSGALPLVLGGDHSLAIGSIAGASKFFKRMAVIWVDAHGDINDIDTSPSGHIHGMPLAASINIGHPSLTDLYYEGIKVLPNDVYIIGARDLDPGEVLIIEENNVNLFTMDQIKKEGLGNVLKTVIASIKEKDFDGVHLSYDIDSMDADIIPGTGTPVKNGFTVEESKIILENILKQNFITSMDFVELNPVLDKDEKTSNICMELIEVISKFI